MRRILTFFINAYRLLISPVLGPHCRFYPTCSSYALEAIEEHGSWRGSLLAAKRLSRCHPFNDGGYDPVPPHKKKPEVRNSGVNSQHPHKFQPCTHAGCATPAVPSNKRIINDN